MSEYLTVRADPLQKRHLQPTSEAAARKLRSRLPGTIMKRMSALGRLLILVPGGMLPVETSSAATTAAQITVSGTTDATTVATVVRQTPGPALTVATSPPNF